MKHYVSQPTRSRRAPSRSSQTSRRTRCCASSAPPGFIRYGLADIGERKCLSLSLWETRKDAEHAVTVSETWDREHISDRVELRTSQVGDLAYEGVPAKV